MAKLKPLNLKPRRPGPDTAAIVASWSTWDFPDINPFLPPAPRSDAPITGRLFFTLGALGAFVTCPFILFAFVFEQTLPEWTVVIAVLMMPVALGSLVTAVLTYPAWRKERLWQDARIVPAVVGEVDVGMFGSNPITPQDQRVMQAAFHFAGAAALPLAGIMMLLTATRYTVQWVEQGQRRRARIFLGFEGTGLQEGRVLWLLVPNWGKPMAALHAASWNPKVHRMPPEVVAWFFNAWRDAAPDERDVLQDLKQAAKANKKGLRG